MKANELSIGWALTQQNPDNAIARVIENIKACTRQRARNIARLATAHRDAILAATAGTVITVMSICFIYLAAALQGA